MAESKNILIAGFGGQGILFTGKFIVYTGMLTGSEVSWLPSYGPEMRGGTANCSVIISDTPIGSPIVEKPDILVVMNRPSFDKYENSCAAGAKVFVDSTLINRKTQRDGLETFYIPATGLADENNLNGLANMVMAGKVLRETSICPYETIAEAMKKTVPERKKNLFDANIRAIELGWNY
jgi:2-oxoglutarate ferredoxin oxidoreductase subunit gamma